MATALPKNWRKQPTAVLEMWLDGDIFGEDQDWDDLYDEIQARQHDLEDPSSGLGCHTPS